MNALELRYHLYTYLAGLLRPAAIQNVTMVSPAPGEPVKLSVLTVDPTGEERRYEVAVTEVSA